MKAKLTGFVLLVAVIAGGVVYYTRYLKASPATTFRTATVQRGDLRIEIKANGTLEPEEVVDVGAQVMGRIMELGEDPRAESDPSFKGKRVDYCSDVEEGTILARIDPSLYRATLDQAKASVLRAEADLQQMTAKLAQTKIEWERAQKLREVKLGSISGLGSNPAATGGQSTIKGISDSDFVLAKANFEVAKANVDVGKATLAQQSAQLASAQQNFDYTTISSPVKGTIIDRRVNIGQTVVASLNAPSLFLIAKDLRRMEIWTSVNEADIGRLKVGMPVRFSVDAYPGEFFKGVVRQIRLNASMTSNVVLYTVVVTAGNDDLRLLPYLTADVRFEVEKRENVLLVPNAALRYEPRAELVLQATDDTSSPDQQDAPDAGTQDSDGGKRKTVWVRQGSLVSGVEVEIGATDGSQTEIVSGNLKPEMVIVLGENVDEPSAETGTNPFGPPQLRGKGKKKAGL
jgi:HlyD family secretion protein